MNDDRSHSSLLVPPSTQDWMQGVLSAKVMLVMYGDYQDPRSADVYKLIKAIKRELRACHQLNLECCQNKAFIAINPKRV